MSLAPEVVDLVAAAVPDGGRVVVLTGAGVSAASGIPTFRGPEGYWTAPRWGPEAPGRPAVYAPEEIATRAMFSRDPDAVWAWYLYRLGVSRGAAPNPAHEALVRLEAALGDRFRLITQNVDGLHRRAGSTPERTYAVHGDIAWMRCAAECSPDLLPLPDGLAAGSPGAPLGDAERARLVCPACGGRTRPHVLWFDETYDEARYRFDSSLRAAADADLLVTVGTSGATTLPVLVLETAAAAGAALVDVNPEDNPFAAAAARVPRGAAVRAPAVEALPALVDAILDASS